MHDVINMAYNWLKTDLVNGDKFSCEFLFSVSYKTLHVRTVSNTQADLYDLPWRCKYCPCPLLQEPSQPPSCTGALHVTGGDISGGVYTTSFLLLSLQFLKSPLLLVVLQPLLEILLWQQTKNTYSEHCLQDHL